MGCSYYMKDGRVFKRRPKTSISNNEECCRHKTAPLEAAVCQVTVYALCVHCENTFLTLCATVQAEHSCKGKRSELPPNRQLGLGSGLGANRRTIYLVRLGDVHEFGRDWPSGERLQECCQAFFGLPVRVCPNVRQMAWTLTPCVCTRSASWSHCQARRCRAGAIAISRDAATS
jgi:hypothetical protein